MIVTGAVACQFYDADPLDESRVITTPHQAGEVGFFVPLDGGGAVRVHVCPDHLLVLQARYGAVGTS